VQPAFVTIHSAHPEPPALGANHVSAMAVQQLRLLRGVCARLAKNRREGGSSDDLFQCSGQSMRGMSYTVDGEGSGSFDPPEHFRHCTTPRKLQMTQMNVPHDEHG
jgi:hypothetical protein